MFNRVYFQRIVLILIVLACLGLFAVVAFRYQTTDVPTLATAAAKGDTITAAQIRVIPYPANALVNFQSNLITDSADLVGKVAAVPINAGVPLTANLFGAPNAAAKDPRYPAADVNDVIKIKYFIPTDIKSSQGGVIRPNDYVDVIYEDPTAQTAIFVLQKIHVVGARSASGTNTDGATTTASGGSLLGGTTSAAKLSIAGYLLAVSPSQALLLAPLNPANVRLVQVDLSTPDLTGIPSGIESATPTPSVSPAP